MSDEQNERSQLTPEDIGEWKFIICLAITMLAIMVVFYIVGKTYGN